MKKVFVVFFILLFRFEFNGQVGGENIYQFLNLSSSARQIALGGETLTSINDVNQALWNPGIINSNLDNKFSVNYSSFLAGINLGSVSYARLISRRFGTIYGNITYLNYGSLIGADEQGNETGTFNANDIAITFGYARNLPWTNLYFGGNIKVINSNISTFTSFGIASDISITYYSPYNAYSFALVLRNLGYQIKSFDGQKEDLPLKISLGASYQLKYVPLKWYLTIDNLQQWDLFAPNPSQSTVDIEGNIFKENISFFDNAFRHLIIGAEFFPESLINLRLGYNFRRATELKLQNLRTFAGVSFGFGIVMNRFKFNYAYSKYHTATNASTFSLEIDLNK